MPTWYFLIRIFSQKNFKSCLLCFLYFHLFLHAFPPQIQELCLPFLRVAALLKHHIYEEPLPEEINESNEFLRLVYYLELVTGMNKYVHMTLGNLYIKN